MYSFKWIIHALAFALALAGAARSAEAQYSDNASDETFWTIGVSALTDDESSRNLALSFDVAVTEATWLSALVGQSRSPRARADVSADTLAFGIDHRFGLIGVRAEVERWGDSGSIESSDSTIGLYLQTDRVKVELGSEQRDIDITATFVGLNDRVFSRKVPLSADGKSLNVRINPSDRLGLRFGIEDYDYPPGLALLPRIDALNLLSTSTLTLANSFVSEIQTVGIDVDIGDKVLGFGMAKDRSAIDRTELTSFEASLMMPIGRRIDLEFSLGSSRSDLFESGLYGGLLVLIYGGS
jgi:hypothetical protein